MRGKSTIEALMRVQLEKLNDPRNVAKGGWIDEDPMHLFHLLEVEVRELQASLYAMRINDPDEVARECADVANFAAMIAEVVRMRIPF